MAHINYQAVNAYAASVARVIDPHNEEAPVSLTMLIEELDTSLALDDYLDERKDYYDVVYAADSDGEEHDNRPPTQPEELRCNIEFAMSLCLYVDSDRSNGLWSMLARLENVPASKWLSVLGVE